jgi:hypothetical protein
VRDDLEDGNAHGSWLEGPSFDRDGKVCVAVIPFGETFSLHECRRQHSCKWKRISEITFKGKKFKNIIVANALTDVLSLRNFFEVNQKEDIK